MTKPLPSHVEQYLVERIQGTTTETIHWSKFRDARFAAIDPELPPHAAIPSLIEAIDQLGYILDELKRIGVNAHVRIEGEQARIKALEVKQRMQS